MTVSNQPFHYDDDDIAGLKVVMDRCSKIALGRMAKAQDNLSHQQR